MASDTDSTGNNLLNVENLSVTFNTHHGTVEAVRDISFTIGREKVGIVGESGSGKTVTGRSILRLTPKMASVTARRLEFGGIDLCRATERQMREVRGKQISMIMQDPKFSLNPVRKVGKQIREAFLIHREVSKTEARERTMDMLNAVQIRDPKRVYNLYPHEVSGGMGQRIMIAMMLIPDPNLIIADEPTSALDVTVRMQVLRILDDLVSEKGLGLMFISHDLNLVATFCDRVLIMYAGRIVESCRASELHQAEHPYTRGLLDSLPKINERREVLPILKRDPAWLEPATAS
jgi:peptide/nickel transport system ATP-binding protein